MVRQALMDRYGDDGIQHFADTSDTLCYATNENQNATRALIDDGADLAIIVGGTNSSNTSHLAELCEEQMPTYFVTGPEGLLSRDLIEHFDLHKKEMVTSESWLPMNRPLNVLLTAGASCPDILLDQIMERVCSWQSDCAAVEEVLAPFNPVA